MLLFYEGYIVLVSHPETVRVPQATQCTLTEGLVYWKMSSNEVESQNVKGNQKI